MKQDPACADTRGTLAIDVGGTFTDVTFADAATGATWVTKTPSTPDDLAAGFITAIRKVLALADRPAADVPVSFTEPPPPPTRSWRGRSLPRH